MLKAKKGLIRCSVYYDEKENIIRSVQITGDFFLYPEDVLEILIERLKGAKIDRESIREITLSVYKEYNVSSPGLTIDDIVNVIFDAIGEGNE